MAVETILLKLKIPCIKLSVSKSMRKLKLFLSTQTCRFIMSLVAFKVELRICATKSKKTKKKKNQKLLSKKEKKAIKFVQTLGLNAENSIKQNEISSDNANIIYFVWQSMAIQWAFCNHNAQYSGFYFFLYFFHFDVCLFFFLLLFLCKNQLIFQFLPFCAWVAHDHKVALKYISPKHKVKSFFFHTHQ